ncbi:SHOCT domain-containing protein [Streptomyces sp. NBC_01210]|uniref:SHOCT domain-containing protein n=1 Tax=Streptomyces sp. NBC_01210 TaxID=2903774 RepID=UPI003FA3DA08
MLQAPSRRSTWRTPRTAGISRCNADGSRGPLLNSHSPARAWRWHAGPSPEQLLAERFARGDIDEEEYQRRRAALRSSSPLTKH